MVRGLMSARCDTQENLEKYFKEMEGYKEIPGRIFIKPVGTGTALHLICSQEWCDWLHGLREEMPNG